MFIQLGSAGLALSALGGYAAEFADQKKRVGLIGCGWYGKSDLLRLIQVAPVEVVSLCDVDRQMLAGAADIVASRQASRKKPRTYHDYREMLREKDLDIVIVGTAQSVEVPAVAEERDGKTNEVLMMAWMNIDSLRDTLKNGKASYWSRSRKTYWVKGETSGHFQHVKEIFYDCDCDVLLMKVDQVGAACHTNERSCFYRKIK